MSLCACSVLNGRPSQQILLVVMKIVLIMSIIGIPGLPKLH